MNDTFREVKDRVRKLEAALELRGNADLALAQAVSQLRRLVNKGDRSREPSDEIRRSLEKAEALGRAGQG